MWSLFAFNKENYRNCLELLNKNYSLAQRGTNDNLYVIHLIKILYIYRINVKLLHKKINVIFINATNKNKVIEEW